MATAIGSAFDDTTNSNSLAVPFHASAAAGDLCILHVVSSDVGAPSSTPTGWTVPTGYAPSTTVGSMIVTWYWKILTSTDITAGSVAVSLSAINRATGGTMTYRGVNATTPISTDTPSAAGTDTATDATVSESSGTLGATRTVHAFAADRRGTTSAWTKPSAETAAGGGYNTGSGGTSLAFGYITSAASGAFGGGTWTTNDTSANKKLAHVVALNDASTSHVAAGTVAASSATSGTVTATHVATSSTAATAAASGTVTATLATTGTVTATAGTSGAVTADHVAAGTTAATAATTGDVTATLPTSGATAAASSTSGTITSDLAASGTSPAVASTTGAVTSDHQVAGTVAAVSATEGAPTLVGGTTAWPVSGTVASVAGSSGAVTSALVATGAAAATVAVVGYVTAGLVVSATVTVVSDVSGTALGDYLPADVTPRAVPVRGGRTVQARAGRDVPTRSSTRRVP